MSEAELKNLWAFTVAIFAVGGCIGKWRKPVEAWSGGSFPQFTVFTGGLVNGFFADYFGRKKSLLLNNILGIFGPLLMGLSKPCNSYEMIILGRFLIGLNCGKLYFGLVFSWEPMNDFSFQGLNSGLCPMYLNELSPVHIRGSVGTLFQLGATSTIFLSQVLGLPTILGNERLWPLLLGNYSS